MWIYIHIYIYILSFDSCFHMLLTTKKGKKDVSKNDE